jgi:hypothetical protein
MPQNRSNFIVEYTHLLVFFRHLDVSISNKIRIEFKFREHISKILAKVLSCTFTLRNIFYYLKTIKKTKIFIKQPNMFIKNIEIY